MQTASFIDRFWRIRKSQAIARLSIAEVRGILAIRLEIINMNREGNKSIERISQDSDRDRINLGIRLREARKYINLSQHVVAHHLGIPRTALSQIESGRRKIDVIELKKIAELYKQPVSYFTAETSIMAGKAKDIAHLARSVAKLSEHDREELSRFTDYLHARSHELRSKDDG